MYFEYGETEIAYLKSKDKKMAEVIEQVGFIKREVDTDLFSSVIHHIIGQQISTKAQATIWKRMSDSLGTVNAETILEADPAQLQSFGMTFRKVEYIRDFADKVHSGVFDLEAISEMNDQDAIKELSSLKGIGVWTAEMILLFCLQRPDIFSFDDLAIQRDCVWSIIIEKLTENYLKNTAGDSVRIAAWQVCICGQYPVVQSRR